MGRDGTPAKEISFVSSMAYGPKVSDLTLTMGIIAFETRQGGSQQCRHLKEQFGISLKYEIELPNDTTTTLPLRGIPK